MSSALIIVDMQNDFIFGSLAIKDSEQIIPNINELSKKFKYNFITQDSHPINHISFINSPLLQENVKLDNLTEKFKGCFPIHCVTGSEGFQLHKDLKIENVVSIVEKGKNQYIEEFSGFSNPTLQETLKKLDIKTVYVCGLAYDYCVGMTALDAVKAGFETIVISDLTKSISAQTEEKMYNDLTTNNVKHLKYDEIVL